jgi:hypothetical protein
MVYKYYEYEILFIILNGECNLGIQFDFDIFGAQKCAYLWHLWDLDIS